MTLLKEPDNSQMLKDIILSHPYAILALLLLSVLGTVFSLATPLILGLLIDNVLVSRETQLLVPILIAMSGIFLVSALANYLSNNIRGRLNLMLFKELAHDLFGVIQDASLKDLQKIKTGDLLTRTVVNTSMAVQTITSIIPQIIVSVFSIILPFFILFSINPTLAVLSMSPVTLFIISSYYYGKKVKVFQRQSLDSAAGMNSFLKEAFSIVPLTKVFMLERWMHDRFDTHMSDYYDASWDVVKISSMSTSLGMVIYGIPTLLVLTFGSMNVLKGSMSLGTFTVFMGYIGLFFSPVQMLSALWANYKGSQASFDRIAEIFSLQKEVWGEKVLPSLVSKIEFDGICFSYGTRAVLMDFHATFMRGKNYIIGDNGSGKTTLIKLLCGLYRPDKGTITINDLDISSLCKESLRKSISVVFSDALVFDGSIYDNILVGDLSASHEAVMDAAKKAEFHNFVMALPGRYETEVGESGLNLSSGERQKLALARVILRDSPVLIFDEFTKSIDAESKRSILSVINKMNDKIVIIITHDNSEIDRDANHMYIGDTNLPVNIDTTVSGTKTQTV